MSCELTVMDGFRLGFGVWLFAAGLFVAFSIALLIAAALVALLRTPRRQTPPASDKVPHEASRSPRPWN